jgi:hypothetical protein
MHVPLCQMDLDRGPVAGGLHVRGERGIEIGCVEHDFLACVWPDARSMRVRSET